jgi:hypothetical protein
LLDELLNFEPQKSVFSNSRKTTGQPSVASQNELGGAERISNKIGEQEEKEQCIFRTPNPRIYEKNLKLKIQNSRFKRNLVGSCINGDLRYLPEEHQSIDLPNRARKSRSRSRSKSWKKVSRYQRNRMIGALCSQISEKSTSTANFSDFENFNFPKKNENFGKIGSKINSTNLVVYIDSLTTKISEIRDGEMSQISLKEECYKELSRFVSRCARIELDFGLLVGSKLGKYLHLLYVMLLEINDSESPEYQRLLPELSKLRKKAKRKIFSYVRFEP